MAVAIIVAAGTGTRFGGDVPKQFRIVSGKTVLEHTVGRFDSSDSVESIVVVLSQDVIDEGTPALNTSKPIQFIAGGRTRAESVRNGLDSIESDSGVVAVHDGARLLVTNEEIEKVFAVASKTGAACLCVPVTDTIKRVREGKIVETIDRSQLWKAATPQCFDIELLRRAFDEAEYPEKATDECSLVEAIGIDIEVVEGSSRNIKITYEDDLKLAEAYL